MSFDTWLNKEANVYRETNVLLDAVALCNTLTATYQPSSAVTFDYEYSGGSAAITVTHYGTVSGASGNEVVRLGTGNDGYCSCYTEFTASSTISVLATTYNGTLTIKACRGGQPDTHHNVIVGASIPCAVNDLAGTYGLHRTGTMANSTHEIFARDLITYQGDKWVIDGLSYVIDHVKELTQRPIWMTHHLQLYGTKL